MEITDYHAKYYAYELTRRRRGSQVDRITQSLFDASVDLNPHQIDAALFALQNPLVKGVVLADEVGLGKTIEAALVLAQYWAEHRRRLIVICPAALRKQWANELAQKFHLPSQVLDAKTYKQQRAQGVSEPFNQASVTVISYNFAARMVKELKRIPWDLAIFDEAHRLRNAHRESHRTGQAIKEAFIGCKKLLLTATPLQNSLIELYGLSTVIDEHLFGDATSFRRQYLRGGEDLEGLRERLAEFAKRTLRKQVLEYIRYTERKPITIPFVPSEDEQRLYHLVSAYLQRENTYGVPHRQRHLVTLVVRKLLASSTSAIVNTLHSMIRRLKKLEQTQQDDDNWLENLIDSDELEDELLEVTEAPSEFNVQPIGDDDAVNLSQLRGEIAELEQYLDLANRIQQDAKSEALLSALQQGFENMASMNAERKAVIFTESRRTQDYLLQFLERHGFAGKIATFSGTNNSATTQAIYQRWLADNQGSDQITGSAAVDRRTALIDHFRNSAEILIATEAAAEGVNLQFCSLVINYDLPWNPQRVEQRIGRCHRYGQKFDVVVINFLNRKNDADRRVLELLRDKFQLFDGLFGASDEVLGRIESGLDFEKRIADIYNTCRTTDEIETAFNKLQKDLEESINEKMQETQEKLLEHFDAQIHDLLKNQYRAAEQQLDLISRLFWQLTKHQLKGQADFNDVELGFGLMESPVSTVPAGDYALIRKGHNPPAHTHLYRLSHPLGEWVLDTARRLDTPAAQLNFELTNHPVKYSALEPLVGQSGWLELNQLELDSFQKEEHLVFTALTAEGELLDKERAELMFRLAAKLAPAEPVPAALAEKLQATVARQLDARLSEALDENNQFFERERNKLEAWAEDNVKSAEQKLEDTRAKLKEAKRLSRTAQTPQDQKQAQEDIKKLERTQRHNRQNIFDVEDEIERKRDDLIEALEKQMHQRSSTHHLFRVRWKLV
ncbi:SNF2-related protein [Gilvimarinus sp. 1_MG-2023]|uniref:SNF2-related protein n=1 Tax=Gilvimarinus sp. 1_MG-2023 TaxID=3062638 RepID=UPI0026E29554|nr:SNF2-related protein [Gilvimarinus sp. 1_MG-2023]MDO6748454.1 SNF2-related protein [Gilvimarinus sp. 1_MG-2023]